MTSGLAKSGLNRVMMNVAFITGATFIGRILNLVLYAALARVFGPDGLGGYATAIAVASYFLFLSDFGLSPRLVREGAVAPENLGKEYANAVGFKLGMVSLSFSFLILLTQILPYEPWVLEQAFLLGSAAIIRSFSYLNESVFRSRDRFDLEGMVNLLNATLLVGTTLLLFYLGYSIRVVGYVSLGASIVQVSASFLLARKFVPIRASMPPWRELGRAALPYATTSLTVLAFAQVDVLIVSIIESQEFVGRYSSVSRLLLVAGVFGALAASSLLPTTARFYGRTDKTLFASIVNEALRCTLIISSLAALGLTFIAQPLLWAMYGEQFTDLHSMLQAGAIYLVFNFVVCINSMVLTSIGRQGDRARSILIGLGATVVLVSVLAPMFGILGTVAAMVGSEFVLMSCLSWFLRSFLDRRLLLRTVAVLVVSAAAAVMAHFGILRWGHEDWGVMAVATAVPLLVCLGGVVIGGEGLRAWRFFMGMRGGNYSASSVG